MRRHVPWVILVVAASVMQVAPPALAGMPAPVTLREMARMRIEAISFFLVILLALAKGVQWIWNGLRSSALTLPRLTYGKALGLVSLWGLLFIVVLAMISGARELMTPGAWERQGATYRLVPPAGR